MAASTSTSLLRIAPRTRICTARSISTSSIIHAPGPWAEPLPKGRPLNTYIVIAEDHSDAGAWSRRMEVRERHLEQAADGKKAGRLLMGGAILKRDFPDMPDDEPRTTYISGSVLMVQGESVGEVRARLSQDEYVRSHVFDPAKLRILPFLPAIAPPPPAEAPPTATTSTRPRSQSAVFRSRAQVREVRQVDPAPGLTLRAAERRAANSLSQLRKMQGHKLAQPPAPVTLGALRKTHIPAQ